ncbi:MAG: glutathione S-transferase [Motiliproteus sp.]
MNTSLPILYTFRRCPYAIRARIALAYSGQAFVWREVVLKDKPAALLSISPKATVPVLQLADGRVIDESRDIMLWTLRLQDPQHWFDAGLDDGRGDHNVSGDLPELITALIDKNDTEFKTNLDRYKYADRYPEHPASHYRAAAETFIQQLELRLSQTDHLMGHYQTLADAAIFPFIRQFAGVDPAWFGQAPYPHVRQWLQQWLQSELFLSVMPKQARWNEGDVALVFPPRR